MNITLRFLFGIFYINFLFCFVHFISYPNQIDGNLMCISKPSFKSKQLKSINYNLWTSPGILDGLFPMNPGATLSSDPQKSRQVVSDFSYYKHGLKLSNKRNFHRNFQELESMDSLAHDTESLGLEAKTLALSGEFSKDHISHLHPAFSSHQKGETLVPLLKDIVKMNVHEQPANDAKVWPHTSYRVSKSATQVHGEF
ncbi:hypothetical protein DFH28DRAFT_629383 [Melampsora americana]|nr:hypothetical protein DFH28DRAFT_629383 [Melampsora americana]